MIFWLNVKLYVYLLPKSYVLEVKDRFFKKKEKEDGI